MSYDSKLDLFGSVFKRSVKHHFRHVEHKLEKVYLLGDEENMEAMQSSMQAYCPNCLVHLYNDNFLWKEFKQKIAQEAPDLIVLQRHLGITQKDLRSSLSPILECITQEVQIPLLVLPSEFQELKIATVGIGFDHQIDNSDLVNRGLLMHKFLKKVAFIHIEDVAIFNYYMDAISRIPEINTEQAETHIKETILSLSEDFFEDAAAHLEEHDITSIIHCELDEVVKSYERIVAENKIDLLVFEAQDETKLAMHSLGQSMTIQFPDLAIMLV